jgi:hypothetical protein
MRPIALRHADRDRCKTLSHNLEEGQKIQFPVRERRPLGSTSVNVHIYSVGRPGLDPSA